MIVEDIYRSKGISCIEDLDIDNVASKFNVTLFKDFPADVRIKSNDIDFIMLQTRDLHMMTESFFHELAHILQHGHTHISDSYRKYCESQANKLMYELAVPFFMIKEAEVDYKYIMTHFNVSENFALARIEHFKNEKLKMIG